MRFTRSRRLGYSGAERSVVSKRSLPSLRRRRHYWRAVAGRDQRHSDLGNLLVMSISNAITITGVTDMRYFQYYPVAAVAVDVVFTYLRFSPHHYLL